jgi:perosamine synthetase
MLPIARAAEFGFARSRPRGSVLDARPSILLRRGATAIRLCLQLERIGAGDEVLLPAFHCPSMLAPIVASGAAPKFYAITEDLECDLASIRAQVSLGRTRAVLAPHFLGRIQDFAELRGLCDDARMVLIEDCAHALVGAADRGVGEQGDYVIASPRKFVPLPESGLLAARRLDVSQLHLRPAPAAANLRVLYDMVDLATSNGRMTALSLPLSMLRGARRLLRPNRRQNPAVSDTKQTAMSLDDGTSEILGSVDEATALTRRLLDRWQLADAARIRRGNYSSLVQLLAGTDRFHVLESRLPLSEMPYVVPVLLSDPQTQFERVKRAGIPLWRWEHSVPGVCPVTDRYAQALLQVPCHQSLGAAELRVIAAAFHRAGVQ